MGNHETEETGDGWLRGGVGWLVVVAVVVVRGGAWWCVPIWGYWIERP